MTSATVQANIREKSYTKAALFKMFESIKCQLFRYHVKKSDIYLAKFGDLTTAAETV
jgi:glutamate formiminotransferase